MKEHESITKEFLTSYDELSQPLFRYCNYKVSNREKALDLVQETFTRVWEYLAAGKKILHLKSFIYRTANNLIIDDYRRKKMESLDALVEDGVDFGEEESARKIVLSAEATRTIAHIKELPDPYRETMELRYITGLSIREIAEMLEESENNISVKLTRGTHKLKGILDPHNTM